MANELPEGMVTLLFTDLEGSTANASSLGEEAAQDVRRRHFELVRGEVERHRGREVKTMGDGFMVAFTSTRRAVQCAVDIQRSVEKERLTSPGTPRVRIGLNAGEVVQDEADLFGLMVNAAARIMAEADGGQVLVSESVKMLLGPASGIEFKDTGEHDLKGFSEAWRLFDVPFEVAAAASADPQRIFVGREAESSRLNEALSATLDGHGSVVAVVGEPGIGKTRLVSEFSDAARRLGAQVHWGATHESAGAPAFWPWVKAIRSLNASIDVTPFQPYIEEHAEDLVRVFPEVRTVVPDLPEPDERPASAGEAAQFRMFEAICGYLQLIVESQPQVVVLDDLHWADKPTLLLLRFIAAELGQSRLLVIGTYRDVEIGRQHPLEEVLADLHRSGHFSVIDLKGLDEAPVREFIARAGGLNPPPEVVADILAQTEGNPFFLGETVALMARDGSLAQGGVTAIPQSVRAVVGQRLNRLGEECNEVLRVAAVAGREFRLDVLAEVTGKDEDAVLDLLDEATDAHVVDDGDRPGVYRFHHALLQETLLGELSTTRRVRLHSRVGSALEERFGERPERAAEIAFHFGEAAAMSEENAAKAMGYLVKAAEHATSQFAWGEAARLYRSAVTLAEDEPEALREHDAAWLHVNLSISAVYSGDYRTAWKSAHVSTDLFRARGEARGFAVLAETVFRSGLWFPVQRVADLLDEGLALGEGEPDLRLMILKRLVTGGFQNAFDADRRNSLKNELRQLLKAIPDTDGRMSLAEAEAFDLIRVGSVAEAVENIEEVYASVDIASLVDQRWSGFEWLLQMSGDLEGAERELVNYLRASSRSNQTFMRENSAAYLASLHLLKGRVQQYDELSNVYGQSESYVWAGCQCAWLVARGQIEAAVERLPDVDILRGITVQLWDARCLRASVHWAAGHFAEAADEWSTAESEIRALDPEAYSQTTGLFEWGWAVGYLDEAGPELVDSEIAEKIRSNFRPGGAWEGVFTVPNPPICMLRLGAHWLVSGGEIEAGKARFERSLGWCQEQGLPLEEGRSWLGLAQVAEIEGDHVRARDHLDRAEPIFERLDAKYFVGRVNEQRARLEE